MARVSPVLVRLVRGVQGCDTYIGNQWVRNGWNLPESPWADMFLGNAQKYEQHVRKNLMSRLGELENKVLGCWCEDLSKCHGSVLIRLWREAFPDHRVDPDIAKRPSTEDPPAFKIKKSKVNAAPYRLEKPKEQPAKAIRNQTTHPQGIRHAREDVKWPTLNHEWNADTIWIDEAGMGSWAGPLYVAGTILLPGFDVKGLHDSKLLHDHEREHAYEALQEALKKGQLLAHIAIMSPEDIDQLKLGGAWRAGIRQIISALVLQAKSRGITIQRVVLDGNKGVDQTEIPVTPITMADRLYAGVSAASILAKVGRDQHMTDIADKYPEFKTIFSEGHGYCHSAQHLELLKAGKHTDIHRKSFKPLKTLLAGGFIKIHKASKVLRLETTNENSNPPSSPRESQSQQDASQ